MANVYYGECPCKDCEKKGCGVYHNECEKYKNWKNNSMVICGDSIVNYSTSRDWELFPVFRRRNKK